MLLMLLLSSALILRMTKCKLKSKSLFLIIRCWLLFYFVNREKYHRSRKKYIVIVGALVCVVGLIIATGLLVDQGTLRLISI